MPILLWGDGVRQGEARARVQVIDLARTIADRLRLPPDPRGGHPLP